MNDLFTKLIDGNSKMSSKRFIALYFSFWFTVVVCFSLYGKQVQSEIVWGLITLITGSSVLTTIPSAKEPKYKEDEKY